MAAQLSVPLIDCAPGNSVTLTGSGLTGGTGASVVLQQQGILAPADLSIAATFSGTSVTFTVPDGVTSANLVVTASDGTSATCFANVQSQYLQSSQYLADGEGLDVSGLAAGVLDNVLRDASGYIDSLLGTSLRILQVQEDQRFKKSRRVYPYRNPIRKIPLVSLDALTFITSNAIQTAFNVSGAAPDVYMNKNLGYCEVQTYAVGNAMLLGAIQTIGFSADVWRITYTAGYPWAQVPREVRKATAIIATELMVYSGILAGGFGGFSKVREGEAQYERRNEEFAIPAPAMQLLHAYQAPLIR